MAEAKQAGRWPFANGKGSGLSKLRNVVDDVARKGAELCTGSRGFDPLAGLRGSQPLEAPMHREGGRLNYLAELAEPSIAPALTRKADRDGHAYFEER